MCRGVHICLLGRADRAITFILSSDPEGTNEFIVIVESDDVCSCSSRRKEVLYEYCFVNIGILTRSSSKAGGSLFVAGTDGSQS